MSLSLAAQADEINEAIADDPPKVGEAAPNTVTLLRGVMDQEIGEWQTTATVREMTGEDEEELARLSTKDDLSYAEYTSALLRRAVTSVGTQSVITNPSLLDNLIIGDRDLLFLGVVKATYGNIREYSVTCGHCDKSNEVQVNLDKDFPVMESKGSLTEARTVKLRNGTTVKVKYLTGKDAQSIAAVTGSSAEQNTAVVAHAVVWDDDRSEAVKTQWAKELSLADRQTIISTVLEDQPGPTLEEVDAPCGHCGENITMVLDWASLLFG
jgi:hypothetical protein